MKNDKMELWKLPYDEKIKLFPELVAEIVERLFSPNDRQGLVVEADIYYRD